MDEPQDALNQPAKQQEIALHTSPAANPSILPNDEWERGLLDAAQKCGVSLPDSAFSSEELYE